MAKEIFEIAEVYIGMRNLNELAATRMAYTVDHVLRVDASRRKEKQESSSNKINEQDCTRTIDNNGNEEQLAANVRKWIYESKLPRQVY